MNKNLLFTAILLCFAFGACKKSSGDKKQVKLLTKITKTTDGKTTTTLINYDSKNRIIDIGGTAYTYNGDDLVAITQGITVQTITYNSGIPVSINVKGGGLNDNYNYTVLNGRVLKRAAVGTAPVTYDFTYLDNNLMSETSKLGTVTYVYGLDKSPYYNARIKYVFNPNMAELFSENELIESYYQFSPRLGTKYSYLRDPDDYPKSATIKQNKMNDPDGFIYTDVTYEYEMRDAVE